jgi:hypothetical protein
MAVARFDALRSLAFGGISGTYATVGTPLTVNWKMFKITNNTNGDLFISADGTTDNLFIPALSFTLYDLSTNAPPVSQSDAFSMSIGTQFYAKQSTAPSSGSVYIEGVYAKAGNS